MHELKEVIALHHSKIGQWILSVNTNLIWEKKIIFFSVIPDNSHFWYANIFFRPKKVRQKSA